MEKIFYLANVFEGINLLATILMIVGCIVCVVFGIMYISARINNEVTKDDDKYMKALMKPTLIITVISILCVVFVPGRKTYLLMSAGKIVDKVAANDPKVRDIPKNTIELLGSFLQSELQKLEEDRAEEETK